MNVEPEISATVVDADSAVADVESVPKPRRRRTAKPTADAQATAGDAATMADAVTPAPGTAAAAATEPAPSKPRRRRVDTAPADAALAVEGASRPDPAGAPPPPSAPAPAPDADAEDARPVPPSPAPAGDTPDHGRIDPVARRAARDDADDDHDDDDHGDDADAATRASDAANPTDGAAEAVGEGENADADGVDGPRSNRRRNRRDRKRAQAAAGEPPRPGPPEAEAQPLPPADPGELFAQVLSGAFDQAPPAEEEVVADAEGAAVHKRVLLPEPEAPKLHKVLAQSGIGSRRDMEELIAEGAVTVNGEPAHVGQRVSFGDRVQVNGKPVKLRIMPLPPRLIAYHKPVGEIVTHDDPQNRPTVFRRLPRLPQGKWQSVGRLDINTEGLLLFTNSGELANQLMHPRFGVEREYAVRLLGTLTEEHKATLLGGVEVDGQTASFRSIVDGGGDGANHWYRVVIAEGRNREVRKLFDTVGLTVSRLIRIRYGTVVLPFGLKRGVWVDLADGDVRAIRRMAAPQPGPQVDRPPRADARSGGRKEPRPYANGPSNGDRFVPRGGDERRPDRQAETAPVYGMAQPQPRRDDEDAEIDFDPASIPNPLEQTFDKRFVSNPRSSIGGRGFRQGGGGFGAGGSAPAPGPKRTGPGPKQPDPLQTSLGVFGADAFHRKNRGGGGNHGGGNPGGGSRGGHRGGGFNGGGRRDR